MVCKYCGEVMQSSTNARNRIRAHGTARVRCVRCRMMYEITQEDIDNEEDIGICKLCGKERIADGHKTCIACYLKSRKNNERQKQMAAIQREKNARKGKEAEESIDDIAIKARKHGMSYGKYLAARYAGYVE